MRTPQNFHLQRVKTIRRNIPEALQGNTRKYSPERRRFADNIVRIANSSVELQELINKLDKKVLKMSSTKTKVII